MAGVNIGNVGLTFTRYLDGVVETLNSKSKARALVSKDDSWTGSHIEGRIHTARTTALGYVEDGGAFPVADKQDYDTYKAYRKFIVGTIQLTDGVMATASKSGNVAKDVVTSEVKGLMEDILKFENIMFFRNGDGSVATVTTNYAGGTPTLIYVDDARGVWPGGQYQVYDSTLATNRGTVTVSSVDYAPSLSGTTYRAKITCTGSAPAAMVATDLLVWNGAVNRAITGLSKLVDDTATTFQNINVANVPRYASLVLDNSGTKRDLTPLLFRQCMAGLMQKTGEDKPTKGLSCLCSSWGAINVEELYEGELRLTPESKVGGTAVAAFQSSLGRVDIVVDCDCTYNRMYLVDFSQIYRGVQKQLAWRRQGGEIFKRSDTAGVWTATAMEIAELYIKGRHTSARIDDLNEVPVTMM